MIQTIAKWPILAMAIAAGWFGAYTAQAQFTSPAPLSGHAWSDTTGWVSMSGPGHQVAIESDGDVVGYAWSSNVGWIKFGGLSSFPDSGANASFDTATGEFTGWARACAGTAAGDCSSMTDHIDGWDGWISLSCDNTGACGTSNYGVSASGNTIVGFAWGSDVVGWLSFDAGTANVTVTTPCTAGYQCLADNSGHEEVDAWCNVLTSTSCSTGMWCEAATPNTCTMSTVDGSITLVPPAVRAGRTVEVQWSSTDASNCTLEQQNAAGNPYQSWTGTSGSEVSNPINQYTIFSLSCTHDPAVAEFEVASTTVLIIPNIIET